MLSGLHKNTLIVEGSRIIGNTNSNRSKEISHVDNSIKDQIQTIAKKIKKDAEFVLSRSFDLFLVVENTSSCTRSNNTQYSMKINVGDEAYLRAWITSTDPDESWNVCVGEYVKAGESSFKPIEKTSSCIHDLIALDKSLKNDVQSLCDYIKLGVELIVGKAFTVFEVIEWASFTMLGLTNYYLRIVLDDNWSVKVKVYHKTLEKEWCIQVEEYDKHNAFLEGKPQEMEATLGESTSASEA